MKSLRFFPAIIPALVLFLSLVLCLPSNSHCSELEGSSEEPVFAPATRINRTVISKGLVFSTYNYTKTVSDYSRLSNLVRSYPSTIVIHSFRINPEYFSLAVATDPKAGNGRRSTIQDIVRNNKAKGGINGGFFDEKSRPLGLHISDSKTISKYSMQHKNSAAIFFKKENSYNIITNKCYLKYYLEEKPSVPMTEAIQSYPLLVANGKPLWDWRPGEGIAPRTAVGVTWSGRVILAVTDTNPLNGISLSELATFMATTHKCKLALNLDGGTSSQFYYHDDNHTLSVDGQDLIRTAIIIKKKN
jgi:uncharacterized protein YigE (DUF2233 family)